MHDSQNIEKNQLFHVQYLSMVWQQEIKKNKLTKRRQNEIQPQGTWTFVTGLHKQMGSVILAILFFYQSGSFLDSYLKNGHHFIQCICDDKHIRTKVMNLKGLSDYSAPF